MKWKNFCLRFTIQDQSIVSAIRYNPVVKRYYNHKKEQRMNGNKLMTTCANKLLNIIYSVMKNNMDFKDPELVS